ncbi:unnamed protein product [Protopolystoma xenopodis]|uniref:Fibronectin type-III domain-containing protein n=1 Tax=Protopolystoma xenopodis TaxID=117903 RepID=A0A3S5BQN6_9PLAT|nr:unnamed protein product [Protopolystoma xenopodis]
MTLTVLDLRLIPITPFGVLPFAQDLPTADSPGLRSFLYQPTDYTEVRVASIGPGGQEGVWSEPVKVQLAVPTGLGASEKTGPVGFKVTQLSCYPAPAALTRQLAYPVLLGTSGISTTPLQAIIVRWQEPNVTADGAVPFLHYRVFCFIQPFRQVNFTGLSEFTDALGRRHQILQTEREQSLSSAVIQPGNWLEHTLIGLRPNTLYVVGVRPVAYASGSGASLVGVPIETSCSTPEIGQLDT